MYFTALFPYLILFILMIRGALMAGSLEGVKHYIRGYGDNDRPDSLTAFYLKTLGDVGVSTKLGEENFTKICLPATFAY